MSEIEMVIDNLRRQADSVESDANDVVELAAKKNLHTAIRKAVSTARSAAQTMRIAADTVEKQLGGTR